MNVGADELTNWAGEQSLQLADKYGYEFGFTIHGSAAKPVFGRFYTDYNSISLSSLDDAYGWRRGHTHPKLDGPGHSGEDRKIAMGRVKYGLKDSVVFHPSGRNYIYPAAEVRSQYGHSVGLGQGSNVEKPF